MRPPAYSDAQGIKPGRRAADTDRVRRPAPARLGAIVGRASRRVEPVHVVKLVAQFRPSLDRARNVLALAVAATLSTVVSATVGVASLRAGNAVSADALLSTWRTWWLGDLGGALLVAPFLLVFAGGMPSTRGRGRLLEGVGLLAALALVSWFVFSDPADRTFLIFPVLAWAALRFRQAGVTAASLIVAAIAAGFTAHGLGPFAQASEDQGLLMSQMFVGVTALVSLLLAAITAERQRAESALRSAAEARFRGVFEGAPTGMALMSLEGRFEQVNGALCEISGRRRDELEGGGLELIASADDLIEMRRHLDLLLAGEPGSYRTDKRCLHASGETGWTTFQATLLRDAQGEPLHFLTQMLDITDRRRNEENLRYMVDHDPLTGLLNRRSFERELNAHLVRGRRYGLGGAAVMLDLDCFKQVNDSLGHRAGDELIVHVAQALRGRLRETDVVARLSGDEFIVLLPQVDRSQAREVARELLAAVRTADRRTFDGTVRSITASVGVAMIEDGDALTGEDIMVSADVAMYDAKNGGRDCLAFSDPNARADDISLARAAVPARSSSSRSSPGPSESRRSASYSM